MRIIFVILIILTASCEMYGQELSRCFTICDKESKAPIENVHVFIPGTTYGTTSDNNGVAKLDYVGISNEDLLFSHISYDSKYLGKRHYTIWKNCDTLFLNPNQLNLEEIEIVAKRTRKWEKQFKKFKKHFLGETRAAGECEILNPQVLRFKEVDGELHAGAVDLIEVRNNYLAYEIQYYLTGLILEKDGSVRYQGKALFKDIITVDNAVEIKENREKVFKQSSKDFFQHLIRGELGNGRFELSIVKLENNRFELISTPQPKDILKHDTITGNTRLYFPYFLSIQDKTTKVFRQGRINDQPFLGTGKFINTQSEGRQGFDYVVSDLYKISQYLEIDPYGNILNSEDVKEYGFWASQKIADMLPFTYGVKAEFLSGNKPDTNFNELK